MTIKNNLIIFQVTNVQFYKKENLPAPEHGICKQAKKSLAQRVNYIFNFTGFRNDFTNKFETRKLWFICEHQEVAVHSVGPYFAIKK